MRPFRKILIYCKDDAKGGELRFLLKHAKPSLSRATCSAHVANSFEAVRALLTLEHYDAVLLWEGSGAVVQFVQGKYPLLIIGPDVPTKQWMEDLHFLTRKKPGPKKAVA